MAENLGLKKVFRFFKSPVSEGEKHRVKNEDEIDETHKSQLKF